MTKFSKTVPFDPGYGPFVLPFSDSIEAIKFEINKYKSINQKRFKFKTFEPNIRKLLDNTLSFYLGCMLWAGYIHYRFIDDIKEISDNPFLTITKEQLESLDFLFEVNFVLDYLEQFEKDSKYYQGKGANLNPMFKQIAEEYKKFLELNNNFVGTKNTSELKLPDSIKHLKNLNAEQLDNLYQKLEDSINQCKLESLLQLEFYTIPVE